MVLAFLGGCDGARSRPVTPANEIIVVVAAAHDHEVPGAFDAQLAAPVVYLGRAENPFQVRRSNNVSWAALESLSTAIVIEPTMTRADSAADWWARLVPVVIDSLELTHSASIRWSVYDDISFVPQTIIRVRGAFPADEEGATRLAVRLRQAIEASEVRHRVVRLARQPGAAQLPRRATRDAFRILLPAGYAWSDTSSGWPHSVQMVDTHPTRVVSIFWLEDAQAEWLHSDAFLLGFLRDAIWRLHQDHIAEESVQWINDSSPEPELRAIWQNPEAIAGGPMQVRFVYDPARQRLYGVQAMIFLPGADKHATMREVVAVASTFRIQE
jgi:hypothetical protein